VRDAPDDACPLYVQVEYGKKDIKRLKVRIRCAPGEPYKHETSRSCIASQICDSMRGEGRTLRDRFQHYACEVGSGCDWRDFCLGAGCYLALYQLLECGYFCDLPFPVCLPVRLEKGVFTCHTMHYMHTVASALRSFGCPLVAQLAAAAAAFCACYRHAFVEGCRVDEGATYRQVLDIVFSAAEFAQAAALQVSRRSDHINSFLDTLEKKMQHRLDMAVGRMQRDFNNLSIDLQEQIAQQIPDADDAELVLPSVLPWAARTIPASSISAADRSVFS